MKKAFNFKKLLVCVLILILCLSAFVACDKDKGQGEQPYDANGINMAVRALKANLRGSSVNADFTLDNHQMFAGVSYPVSWAITANDGEASDVTLTVDGDKTTVHVNGKTKKDVAFTLTATVSDAKGLTATAEFKYSIPAYKLLTHAEYIATKAGEAVTVQGIVSHYGSKSNGAQYNNLFMYDQDGGYYIYTIANSVDPANIQGLHLGAKVEVTGQKDIYNGTHEVKDATIKVIDSSTQAVFEDITDVFKSATTISDAALAAYEYKLVTIKNVEIGDIDDSEKHNYYFFKSGSLETYIRLSTSECMLNAEQQAAFKTAFAADKGKLATVKGCVVLYNGQLYLNPVDTTPYTIVNTEGLSAQEQVNFAVGNTFVQSTVSGNGSSITLPTVDSIFNDVKITWSVDKTDLCAIADGKATFTFLTDNTVKLTATFTHSTDASATATKDFTITLKGAELITIAELYDKAVGDTAYYVEGYVVAVDKASDGKCSFVLQDGTASIFSYNKLDVKLGDHVKVLAKRSSDSYGFPQLGSISYEKLADGTFEPAVNEMAITDVKVTKEDAPEDLYTKKLWKITGSTLVKGSYGYQGNYNGSQVLSLKLNEDLETVAKSLEGKNVVIYGYSRGINTSVGYFTVQVTKIEEAQMTDTEKVAYVKGTLNDFATGKDFDLTTSDVATITWALKSGTGATLEGNHVTITQTDADQTVVFTATIVSGEASDTKDITVTIKAKDNRVAGVKGVVGTAYKIVMNQTTLNKTLYLNGKMAATYYFGTTENVDEAVDVYLEVVSEEDGTFRLYTMIDNAKKYIEIVPSGSHINVKFNDTVAGNPWTWNDTLKMYQTAVSGAEGKENGNYTLGTYGDKNTFSAQIVTSTSSFFAQLYGTPDPVPVKTNQELVDEAAEALRKDFTITAKSSGATIDLAATGINNATIVWTSSDNAVIAIGALTDGKYVATVNNPTTDGMTVTLTAVLTVGEGDEAKTANCTFPITVTRTLANVEVSLGEITGGTVDVFVGENKQTLPVTLKQEQVITLTPVATDGYELVKVFVNGTELVKGTDGAYTYTLGTTNVQITATFRKITFVNVSVEETIANGSVTVNVGKDALDTTKQYRDGTVLTITATANAGYKLVAVKVNGEKLTGNTYTIKETDTAVAITAEFGLLPTSKVEGAEIKTIEELEALIPTAGNSTKERYYTMGYIKSIENTTFGNATLEDFNGKTFTIYGMYDFAGSVRYDSLKDKPVAGDFVVLYGTLKNYNGTKEMIDARIAQLNDTVYAPTFAARVEEAKNALTLEAEYGKNFDLVATGLNGTTITWISSNTGLVSIADTAVDGKYLATVTVPDTDKTVTLTATITLGTAQDTKEITVTIKANTKVTLNYGTSENGTFEVKANGAVVENGAQLDAFTTVTVTVTPAEGYQLASYTLGEGEAVTTVAGQTSFTFDITATTNLVVTFGVKPAEPVLVGTLNFATKDQRKSQDTSKQVWEEGGITLTNTGSVADYANPVRLYKSTKVTIACEGMTKLVFNVNTKDKKIVNLQNSLTGKGTVTVDGDVLTIVFDSAQSTLEFTCADQIRLNSIEVYAMA